jgi:hypothetical protein
LNTSRLITPASVFPMERHEIRVIKVYTSEILTKIWGWTLHKFIFTHWNKKISG